MLVVGGSAMTAFEMYSLGTKDIDLMDKLRGRLVEAAKEIAERHGFPGVFDGSAGEHSGILPGVAWRETDDWGWLPDDSHRRLHVLTANYRLLTIMKLGAAVDFEAKGMVTDALKHEKSIRYLEARHGTWLHSGDEAAAVLREWAPYVTAKREEEHPGLLERVPKSLFG